MTAGNAQELEVPDRPRVVVVLHSDGSGTVNGRHVRIPANADPRTVLMTQACRFAATLGRPVRVEAHDPDGTWQLVAHPNGSVTATGRATGERRLRRPVLQRTRRFDDSAPASSPAEASPDSAPGSAADSAADSPTDSPAESGDLPDPAGRETTDPLRPAARREGRDTDEDDDDADDPSGSRPIWYRPAEPVTRPRGGEPSGEASDRPGLVDDAAPPGSRTVRPETVVWSGRTPGRHPRSRRSLLVLVLLAALAVATLVALVVPGARDKLDRAEPPDAGAAAGALTPAKLDVAVPPGFSATPVWTVAMAGWSRSYATDDGVVLARDPDGHVMLIEPDAGSVLWTSPEPTTKDLGGPFPAVIDGREVAVVTGAGRLTYWVLPLPASSVSDTASPADPAAGSAGSGSSTGGSGAASAGDPGSASGSGAGSAAADGSAITVPLPAGATVSWAGASPLVQLPNRSVAVVRQGALIPVPLPAGSRGLAADANGVLAVTSTTWSRQRPDAPPSAPHQIAPPPKAGKAPLRIEAVGTSFLLTVWPQAKGTGQVVALLDTRTGKYVVQTQVTAAADLRRGSVVREVGGTLTALGPLVVDTYTAKINVLDQRYVVKSLTRGHAWSMFNGERATDLRLTANGEFPAYLFGDGDPALPVGVSTLADGQPRAVVAAPVGTGWVLAGLRSG